ncbi:hypothetical protein BDP27DRAFT_1324367 [Rhodocollybia butyracea]|uniref:Uncharacterized protein n=1 Tax=Rhodocollybia butyracea TaxID=206335 RepID=A0A9P5U8L8_9AGAR|nr:hypothetical protein BDP27DRAFT_1324367 [Rhodocollybia butyracea]
MVILYRRKRACYKAHMAAMLLLILASTASVIVQWVNQARARSDPNGDAYVLVKDYTVLGIYIFSDVIADALLIYRCYIIWNRDRRVVFLPVLGFVANIVMGILAITFNANFVLEFWILTFVENIALSSLTAGKIWYINNEAGEVLGSSVKTRYNMIAAIILESGIVYSAMVLATSITSMAPVHNLIYASCLLASLTQIVGIAPSLIVIRVALGVDTHDVVSSIAIMASSHTATHSNDSASGDNGSEALLDMSALITPRMREVADLEEGHGQLARAPNSLKVSHGHSSRSRSSKYALLTNEDESENETIRDESPSPGLTPNAQQVEFGGREAMEYPGLKDEDNTRVLDERTSGTVENGQ